MAKPSYGTRVIGGSLAWASIPAAWARHCHLALVDDGKIPYGCALYMPPGLIRIERRLPSVSPPHTLNTLFFS